MSRSLDPNMLAWMGGIVDVSANITVTAEGGEISIPHRHKIFISYLREMLGIGEVIERGNLYLLVIDKIPDMLRFIEIFNVRCLFRNSELNLARVLIWAQEEKIRETNRQQQLAAQIETEKEDIFTLRAFER